MNRLEDVCDYIETLRSSAKKVDIPSPSSKLQSSAANNWPHAKSSQQGEDPKG
jgi:hypothetical protein